MLEKLDSSERERVPQFRNHFVISMRIFLELIRLQEHASSKKGANNYAVYPIMCEFFLETISEETWTDVLKSAFK